MVKQKNIIQIFGFFYKIVKNRNGNICVFCHDFCTNWDLDLLRTSK